MPRKVLFRSRQELLDATNSVFGVVGEQMISALGKPQIPNRNPAVATAVAAAAAYDLLVEVMKQELGGE